MGCCGSNALKSLEENRTKRKKRLQFPKGEPFSYLVERATERRPARTPDPFELWFYSWPKGGKSTFLNCGLVLQWVGNKLAFEFLMGDDVHRFIKFDWIQGEWFPGEAEVKSFEPTSTWIWGTVQLRSGRKTLIHVCLQLHPQLELVGHLRFNEGEWICVLAKFPLPEGSAPARTPSTVTSLIANSSVPP